MIIAEESFLQLPPGARAALSAQWGGIANRALPCGAAVSDSDGQVIASGRNHAYDTPTGESVLENTGIAHAELNALARVPTASEAADLTLWGPQHPCPMCAAAVSFVGIGRVVYLSEDVTDDASESERAASHSTVPYRLLDAPVWSAVATLLFLYTGAVLRGDRDGNIRLGMLRCPSVAFLALELAHDDSLGVLARKGHALTDAIDSLWLRLNGLTGDTHTVW